MSDIRTIIIAIDDSEHSEYAFDFYVSNVHKPGDRIVIVHVPEYSNVLTESSLLNDQQIVSELMKDTEEKTQELVDKYSLKLKEVKLSGHVTQQFGKPGEAIIAATKEEDAAMVILGSRGMGVVRRTFLGSVSDYCLHHSNVPVMVCKLKSAKHSNGHNKK